MSTRVLIAVLLASTDSIQGGGRGQALPAQCWSEGRASPIHPFLPPPVTCPDQTRKLSASCPHMLNLDTVLFTLTTPTSHLNCFKPTNNLNQSVLIRG